MTVDIRGRMHGDIVAHGSMGAYVKGSEGGTKDYNKLNNKPLILDASGEAYEGVDDVEYRIWEMLNHPEFSEVAFTGDYNPLINKPSIEGTILQGDRTKEQIGVGTLSATEIEKILYLGY